jgi:hypothetical protein
MDDFEEDYKIENIKRFKIDVIIIIIVFNTFIYLIFQTENLKFISKYLNINL